MIVCPGCGQQLALDDTAMGKTVRCTGCNTVFVASAVYAPPPPVVPTVNIAKLLLAALAFGLAIVVGLATVQLIRSRPVGIPPERPTGPATPLPPVEPPPPMPVPKPEPMPPPVPSPPPLPTVEARLRADTLWDQFGLNATAAETRYLGKALELEVRGRWQSDADGRKFFGGIVVEKGAFSPAQIQRMSEREQRWQRDGYPANIRCFWHADAPPPAEGDLTLKIVGVCKGKKEDDEVYGGYVVVMDGCQSVP